MKTLLLTALLATAGSLQAATLGNSHPMYAQGPQQELSRLDSMFSGSNRSGSADRSGIIARSAKAAVAAPSGYVPMLKKSGKTPEEPYLPGRPREFPSKNKWDWKKTLAKWLPVVIVYFSFTITIMNPIGVTAQAAMSFAAIAMMGTVRQIYRELKPPAKQPPPPPKTP